MARPEYLNCIMTPGIISRIRERQESYDRDPEGWERRERERREEERTLEALQRRLMEGD